MTDPARRAERPLFLIGFMASGKTTVGRLIAARRGWTFHDLDQVIVSAAGRSVAQIFADPGEGEAGFRRREAEAVRAAAALRDAVIATGGGAACVEDNLARMLAAGQVVTLVVSPEEAVRRAGGDGSRPLLRNQATRTSPRPLCWRREGRFMTGRTTAWIRWENRPKPLPTRSFGC